MDLFAFISTILFISLSGALMPGPVFATAIVEGRKNKYSGLQIAMGHAIVEVPLMIALFIFGKIEMSNTLKATIGIAGGITLFYFAFSVLRETRDRPLKGLIAGIALSSLNPYFIVWWLTIGFSLAIQATYFGFLGLTILILFHESVDFIWYGFISFASNKGMRIKTLEKAIITLSFLIMFFFGIFFIYDGIKHILGY